MRNRLADLGVALFVLIVVGFLLAVVLGIAIETLDYPAYDR